MNATLAIAMLLFGSATGFFGWWRATRYVYRRSFYDEGRPTGISRRDFERQIIRRRKGWRIVSTILYALGGAILGAVFGMPFARL
jgi:hypothetical protein